MGAILHCIFSKIMANVHVNSGDVLSNWEVNWENSISRDQCHGCGEISAGR